MKTLDSIIVKLIEISDIHGSRLGTSRKPKAVQNSYNQKSVKKSRWGAKHVTI